MKQDLHPYLNRARLASLLLEREGTRSGDRLTLQHVMRNKAEGDGPLGAVLDRALLDLPTCQAFRQRAVHAVTALLEAMPTDRTGHILLVNCSDKATLSRILSGIGPFGAVLTFIDDDRDTLVSLERLTRPPGVKFRLVQDDLASLCMGRSTVHHLPQHVVFIDGLTEYLPDRLVSALVGWCASHTAPGGRLAVTGLEPSPDSVLFDHLLGWPQVRRSGTNLQRLLTAAGLTDVAPVETPEDRHPGLVVAGNR